VYYSYYTQNNIIIIINNTSAADPAHEGWLGSTGATLRRVGGWEGREGVGGGCGRRVWEEDGRRVSEEGV
jgi:hypothetical protein